MYDVRVRVPIEAERIRNVVDRMSRRRRDRGHQRGRPRHGENLGAIGSSTDSTSAGAGQMTNASLELSRLSASLRTHVGGFLE